MLIQSHYINGNMYRSPTVSPNAPTPLGRLIVLLLLLLALSLGKILAQEKSGSDTSKDWIPCVENDVIKAAVDSAIMYEAVKPIVRQLRIVTNLQNNENENLRRQMSLQDMQVQKERKEGQANARKAGRKGFWLGTKIGFGTASLLYLALFTF